MPPKKTSSSLEALAEIAPKHVRDQMVAAHLLHSEPNLGEIARANRQQRRRGN